MPTFLCIVSIFLLILSGCAGRTDRPPESTGKLAISKAVEQKEVKKTLQKKTEKNETVIELRRETGKKSMKKAPVETTAAPLEQIQAGQKKKVFEFVQIAGEKYPVPRPWRGHRITEKAPSMSELKKIPAQYSWNDSELFIRRNACDAFVKMAKKAEEDDVHLMVHSGFRSIWYQRKIFTSLMAKGRTWEDLVRYVAPPGYSQHMLGQAVDLYPSNWEFASTKAYHWLKENAAAFGFSETYPETGGNGFPFEAWHWHYDGPPPQELSAKSSIKALAKYKQPKKQK